MLDVNALPNDVELLKRLLGERDAVVEKRDLTIRERDRHIEHLKLQLARLRRWKFGQASEALARYVLAGKINADDTPVKVLAPGTGKTKTGYLWTYVRDGRPWKSPDPPAVWYRYSPDHKGEHPQRHLRTYQGKLQVDAYAGFEPLFLPAAPGQPAAIVEVACWAHFRRGLFELYKANGSPTAKQALERIAALYAIEDQIRGQSAELRLAARQQYAAPVLRDLHHWLLVTRTKVENKSELAKAIDYGLNRWRQLSIYTEDGALEVDNNIAERSIRGVGVGKKNFLFFGSDSGGERAAIAYAVIETCKLNRIDPQRYLEYVLARIADHPINRIEELLPWNVLDKPGQPAAVSEAMAA